MRVFARHALVQPSLEASDEELLLEGSWPSDEQRGGRWSLDDSIDARFTSIDRLAMELADRAGRANETPSQAVTFPYINALALRYYLVKLLRVVAFFRDVRPLAEGEHVELLLAAGDEAYADVLEQVAQSSQARLTTHWCRPAEVKKPPPSRRQAWRRWAGGVQQWRPAAVNRTHDSDALHVVLCGNPKVLNPVCAELVSRDCRVWWLYERFAVRSWWRWRALGVEQLVCDSGRESPYRFNDVAAIGKLVADGIDLDRPVERWLTQRAAEVGLQQTHIVGCVDQHFRKIRPTALVIDEDATPLNRIAVALARSYGAKSTVVQHGAPCGPFGFTPMAADEIAVWGDASRRQLDRWGVPAERIRVTGAPTITRLFLSLQPDTRARTARVKRFLLLATLPARDRRPDNVEFHLTRANYPEMFAMVCRVLSEFDAATLTIKLHPRDSRRTEFIPFKTGERNKFRSTLGIRIVHSRDLAALVAASDCVLSCASTAGIEAALPGAPVVQLLPSGSGNILPAEDWGFVGSARTEDELRASVAMALARGWQKNQVNNDYVLAAYGRTAAARIVDGMLPQNQFLGYMQGMVAGAKACRCPGVSSRGIA